MILPKHHKEKNKSYQEQFNPLFNDIHFFLYDIAAVEM